MASWALWWGALAAAGLHQTPAFTRWRVAARLGSRRPRPDAAECVAIPAAFVSYRLPAMITSCFASIEVYSHHSTPRYSDPTPAAVMCRMTAWIGPAEPSIVTICPLANPMELAILSPIPDGEASTTTAVCRSVSPSMVTVSCALG
jgi:hypothetical protein